MGYRGDTGESTRSGFGCRRLLRPAAVTGLLALAIAAVFAPGASAAPKPVVEILTPRTNTLAPSGRVTVKVRIRGRTSGFRARVVSRGTATKARVRMITRRFGRSRRGVRTARLRRSDVETGRIHLLVTVRRPAGRTAVDRAHFTVGRRSRSALRLRGPTRTKRSGYRVVAIGSRVDRLRAELNGRNIRPEFRRVSAGRWAALLAAHHRLRFGRNRLVVTAFNRGTGRYRTVRKRFRVRRTRPLAAAGRDRRGIAGRRVRLDGRATRRTSRRRHLRMRWRIAKRPRGAKATLRDARSMRPTLIARTPGPYTVEVRATETGAGGAPTRAYDTLQASLGPDVLPSGVPIQTIGSGTTPGVTVGPASGFVKQFYPMDNPSTAWMQMVVLNRATLSPSAAIPGGNKTYTAANLSQFDEDVEGLDSSSLVILSGGGGANIANQPGAADALDAFLSLGGILDTIDCANLQQGQECSEALGVGSQSDFFAGDFSLVGVPGLNPGQAAQFVGMQGASNAALPKGAMQGVLQQDVQGNFTFNWPQSDLTFDTAGPARMATPASCS